MKEPAINVICVTFGIIVGLAVGKLICYFTDTQWGKGKPATQICAHVWQKWEDPVLIAVDSFRQMRRCEVCGVAEIKNTKAE